MPISDIDLAIISETLPLVREHLEPASEQFYVNLFTLAPELRSMFRPDLAGQGMRFMSTLVTIADILDDPEAFEMELRDLSFAHAAFGVHKAHFKPIGSALMVTLGETLGADFTPAVHAAWRAAYEEIADRMIARAVYA